jgi:hypothetical protein
MTLGYKNAHSLEAGDDYLTTASVIVPFVPNGAYNGSASFVASTL